MTPMLSPERCNCGPAVAPTASAWRIRRFGLALLLTVAMSGASAQTMPPTVVAENPATTAVAEKRSSGILETLALADSAKAARVKQHIVNFVVTLKNIHEGVNPPAGEAKRGALLAARGELYAGLTSEKLTPEQHLVVKNGLSANHFRINYDAFIGLVPTLTDEEKAYIHAQFAEVCDEAVLLNEGTAKGDLFHKRRGRVNNYLSERGYDLKELSKSRNVRLRGGETPGSSGK